MNQASQLKSTKKPAPHVALDDLIANTTKQFHTKTDLINDFLSERNPAKSFEKWLAIYPASHSSNVRHHISNAIAEIDELLNKQVNAIIHHAEFQSLESTWRGLKYVVDRADDYERQTKIKVRILDASWRTVVKDLDKAADFDQSALFDKIYSQELDMPGGEPFGLIIGDYEISHRPFKSHPTDDVRALDLLSQIAAAAFAPMVLNAHPSLLGINSFGEINPHMNLESLFQQKEYTRWNSLREKSDMRFIGLTMPKLLMRQKYESDGSRNDRFPFIEEITSAKDYNWGGACFAFASIVTRAFGDSGWFAEIRGYTRDTEKAGLVTDIAKQRFHNESTIADFNIPLNVAISETFETRLSDYGFIPARFCEYTNFAVFHSNNALLKPEKFSQLDATTNAKLSAMLQYMLCVSRFAHYIKVIARDRVGSFESTDHLERIITQWLMKYTDGDAGASPERKARYPLQEAKVDITEKVGHPGKYDCIIHLRPHYQLDQLTSNIQLVTEIASQAS